MKLPARNTKKQPSIHGDGTCERCGKPLIVSVPLELDQRIDEYHDFGVPAEFSQGWFDFGPDCAEKLRKRASAAIAKAEGK